MDVIKNKLLNKIKNLNDNDIIKLLYMEILKKSLQNNIKSEHYVYINNLKNICNINYFVWTFSKTGTSSLASALQRLNNSERYENVIHCHTENCWRDCFNVDKNFDIIDIVRCQKKKPIIFQLYRNPISRLISDYHHVYKNNPENTTKDINEYLGKKIDPYYEYYEKKLGFKFSNIKYDKVKKFCFIEKPDFYLFFVALEHFDSLKQNLIDCFNSKGFCFDLFDIRHENVNSYDKKNIKINNDLIEKLFENNKTIIDFYYTDEEIKKFKKLYTS